MSGHCRHLGAHIGHGGKVVGDCVECPFHGWRWGPDGTNRYIPYQPDRPNKALRLRVYPVREQYGCVFAWHQPDGQEPQWELPDLFHKFPQFPTDEDAYYRPYPEFSRRAEHEPVHPQIVAENGPDSAHFHYVHGATRHPGVPELGGRRRGMAIPDGMAGRAQRRSGQDGALHPQPLLRTGLRDQRVRGIVEPPADLRVHARRGRVLGHVLFGLVATASRRHLRRTARRGARDRSSASSWAPSGTT